MSQRFEDILRAGPECSILVLLEEESWGKLCWVYIYIYIYIYIHKLGIRIYIYVSIFYVHVTVYRNKFLYNKTNQMHQFPKFTPA